MIAPETPPPERELTVVIPSYNEAENIPLLLGKLATTLENINYEIIVVDDDSPDLTWKIVQDLGLSDERIRCIRRLTQKGLSSAVVDGMLEAHGRAIAVMDADLQHDESILPDMYREIVAGHDICVGSREAQGGSYGEWSASRKLVSHGAKLLAKLALGPSTKDPMSGFFMLSKTYFSSTVDKVNPSGFKILLEFIVRGDAPSVTEVGYEFRNRIHGETKLNATVALEYLLALIDLKFGWLIPNRFVKFGIIGFLGSLVNLTGFAISQSLGMSVSHAVIVGIELAIVFTYLGNNFFTFSPQTYKGVQLLKGLGIYQLVSIYGLVVQFSIVHTLLQNFPVMNERLITLYFVYLIGVLFAAIGNYFLHAYYTWNRLGHSLLKPRRRGLAAGT